MSVVVIYYSGYGHTKRVAETVAEGAHADLIAIDSNGDIQESDWQKLNDAKAIIFWCANVYGRCAVAVQEVCRCHVESLVCTQLAGQSVCGL